MDAGTVLAGRYRLAERLGYGSMGEVWRAQDTRLFDRDVAVKMMLTPDPDQVELTRFTREAGVAARLAHPGITVVHDIGHHDGRVFIVMELLRGEDLGALLSRSAQGLPPAQVVSFAVQVASALATAHAAGVIHRDLKPANLFVTAGDRVKICDFGLARVESTRVLTLRGEMIGTPSYMAPELWHGQPATVSTDLYALGAIMWQMLTGRLAFPGPSMAALLHQHLNDVPAAPGATAPGLPPDLDELVLSLLAKDPGDRPPSAALVLDELTRIEDSLQDRPTPAQPGHAAVEEAKEKPAASVAEPREPREPHEPPTVPPTRATGPVAGIACAALGPDVRVFALASDGRLRHLTLGDPAWTDLLQPSGDQQVSRITATTAHTALYTRLAGQDSAIAAITDDTLFISRSGGAWRALPGPGGEGSKIIDIAVASWTQRAFSPARGEPRVPPTPVSVFALDADGRVWQSERASWRRVPVSRPVSAIAACSFHNDDQLLLGVSGGAVGIAYYETPSGVAASLPAWRFVPADPIVDIACLALAPESQEAFALDGAGNLWHNRSLPRELASPRRPASSPWSGWKPIEGAPPKVTAIAAAARQDDRAEAGRSHGTLLAVTQDGTVYHASCDLHPAQPAVWAHWEPLPPF